MAVGSLSKLHVLLVDDHVHMRKILITILQAFGIQRITQAKDGREALYCLHQLPIDLVICDLSMQVMDGIEFLRAIRTDDSGLNPFLPVIVVSGHTELQSVTTARDAGANEFVAKPVSPEALYQKLVAVIEKPRPYIRTRTYFGPDRRRHLNEFYGGPERRTGQEGDQSEDGPGLTREEVEELLNS